MHYGISPVEKLPGFVVGIFELYMDLSVSGPKQSDGFDCLTSLQSINLIDAMNLINSLMVLGFILNFFLKNSL